ncbi:MAG: hypothetical protein HG458_003345 [Prevotella sp.]|nr:hypothetical protein [Prevotella sp.]
MQNIRPNSIFGSLNASVCHDDSCFFYVAWRSLYTLYFGRHIMRTATAIRVDDDRRTIAK